MTAHGTAPVYDQLVEELGDVPKDVRTAAEAILAELERESGLSRAMLLPAAATRPWFG
jgi:hypothetical protein